MPQSFSTAEAVEDIANDLIGSYHPQLATARIAYLFQETAGKKGGKLVPGSAKKVSGVLEYFTEKDFLILVALDVWNDMDANKRTALVDHLLECCSGEEDDKSGEMKWGIREPDVHEFSTILKRYGAWSEDLVDFVEVAQSLETDYDVSSSVHVRGSTSDE